MSIVTTPTLRLLYNKAIEANAMETATMAFWIHYLNKHIFTEENWVLTQEQAPSGATADQLRRVDTKIQYSDGHSLRLIGICEAKRAGATPTPVEAQLVQACEAASRDGTRPYGVAILAIGLT
jgi:hypothetical protein